MKSFRTLLSGVVLLLSLAGFSYGQTILTQTTLSAAVSSGSAGTVVVSSATGFSVGTTALYVDNEYMLVQGVNSTTISVIRGQGGSRATTHASGALVFVGPRIAFGSSPSAANPSGSCTRGNIQYLPYINVASGVISDCVGGNWVQGVRTASTPFRVNSPEPGATAYTSINTNGTTTGATTLYCSEVNLRSNKRLTGIALLNGTTVGSDKHYVVLYDSSGNTLANSSTAGVTTANASTYQEFDFSTPFYAVGPARYFACFQANGANDTVRMAVTGVNANFLTKGQTGATFGTIPTLTPPTGFTTAVGPYVYLY